MEVPFKIERNAGDTVDSRTAVHISHFLDSFGSKMLKTTPSKANSLQNVKRKHSESSFCIYLPKVISNMNIRCGTWDGYERHGTRPLISACTLNAARELLLDAFIQYMNIFISALP